MKRRSIFILSMLLVISVAPLLLAWLSYRGDFFATSDKGNYGTLLNPPRALGAIDTEITGKWSLVYPTATGCAMICKQHLERMRAVSLALGKNSHRVRYVLLTRPLSTPDRQALSAHRTLMTIETNSTALLRVFSVGLASEAENGRIYVVDPLGNVMMYYEAGTDTSHILQDMKRLLWVSRVG